MDPILTVSFVIAFALVGFAIFGGMLAAKPKTEEIQGVSPDSLKAIAALSQPATEPEPVWTSPMTTWDRLSPLFMPVASVLALTAALVVCFVLYRSFGGLGLTNSAEDIARERAASFPDIDVPETRGAEPAQFKMPDPPKIDFRRKR
jgi:hypothetical protein